MIVRNKPFSAAAIAGCAMFLAGCATSPKEPDFCRLDGYSGFLKDYSRLEPSPTHPGAWYEQWTELPDYDAFIVDPIQVLVTRTLDGRPIDAEDAAELGSALRTEVTDALRIGGFRIAVEPGPGVARVRGAITELSRTQRRQGQQLQIGGASCEVEITDCLSGKRVAAAVERDEGVAESNKSTTDPYFDAKLVFRHWAARLGLWLRSVRPDD